MAALTARHGGACRAVRRRLPRPAAALAAPCAAPAAPCGSAEKRQLPRNKEL
jgi:hypothetical protein